MTKSRLNWELIAGVSGIAIGLISLWFTYRQVHLSELHDRISVRPRITLAFQIDGKRDRHGWYISNNGLGPAYFTGFQLFVDGRPVSSKAQGGWAETLRMLGVDQNCFSVSWAATDSSLSSGPEVNEPLIRLNSNTLECKAEFEKFVLRLDRLQVQIDYQSIYGEPFRKVAQPTRMF